jgi:hypothetical protein
MRTVTRTRRVVVVGSRPRASALEIVGDVNAGDEAAVFVLGLDPTPSQRRLVDEALAMAAERRFELAAELIPAPSWLRRRLRDGDDVRVVARKREARRWKVLPGPAVSSPDA